MSLRRLRTSVRSPADILAKKVKAAKAAVQELARVDDLSITMTLGDDNSDAVESLKAAEEALEHVS